MKRRVIRLALSLLILGALLASGFACAAPKPTPTPAPAPAPAPTPTAAPAPKPAPTTTPASTPKPTTPAPPYYKGKTITFITPYSAGGGTDLVGRLWARHLGRFIPGNPTIIVNNMPGGGALIGASYAYNARPDGTTLLVGGGGSFLGSLFNLPGAKYDYRKMTMVLADIGGLVYFGKTGIVATPYDLAKPKTKWVFGTTPTGFMVWFYAIASEVMEIPTEKVVAAYSSAANTHMALFSGEINIVGDSTSAYNRVLPFVQKGEIMPLFSTGVLDDAGKVVRDPLQPDIPTFIEIAEKTTGKPVSSGKALEAMKATMGGFGFLHQLLLPPGVPNEAVKTLWEASMQMIKDPAYQKDAEPLGNAPPFVRAGETLDKVFHNQFGMSDETTKWIINLVWEKYHIKPAG